MNAKPVHILGIETSCDDTAVALIAVHKNKTMRVRVLGEAVFSQEAVHRPYGGVYPSLAKSEHEKNLPLALRKALGSFSEHDIDLIAVTHGPGLSPCLWRGIEFAKELQTRLRVPLAPANHIEGHILLPLLQEDGIVREDAFPALALIVSGGHTQLIFAEKIGSYRILGETADDAAGECLDKTARLLGLDYPGGPAIAREAKAWKESGEKSSLDPPIRLPRPMLNRKTYGFSFSGLKTAVLYDAQSRHPSVRNSSSYVQEMASRIQQAVIDVLVAKTKRAQEEFNAHFLIIGGGVSANAELRRQMAGVINDAEVFAAPPSRSTDNGLMPALTAALRPESRIHPDASSPLEAMPNLRVE